MRYLPAKDRFWLHVNKTEGCWEWTNHITKWGYGLFRLSPQQTHARAHRVSYEFHYGPIPDGMFVCHTCDNRKCVRPDHLFLGTHVENMKDMVSKGRQPGKLKADQVIRIRQLVDAGKPRREIADEFCISLQTISDIALRKRRSNV